MGCGGSTEAAGGGGGGEASSEYKHAVVCSEQELPELPHIPSKTESIDCSSNEITVLPDSIGELHALKHLDANGNKLTKLPDAIVGCVNLEKLYLYQNKIKDLPPKFPPALTELNFFNNQIRKLPNGIGELQCLEEVNFASNKLMMCADVHFASWATVKVLNMYDNNLVRFGSLAPLVALEELRMNGNNLEEMPTLGASHPALTIIEMHKNRVTKIADDYFSSTPALARFSIWGNQLEAVPPSICSCSGLIGLQVQENKLTTLPGEPWPAKLETLFVQDNKELASLPESLKACSAMRRCNVSGTKLDGPSLAVADALKGFCLSQQGGIFWAADGSKFS